MTTETVISLAALIVTIVGSGVAWLALDARSKGRADVLEAVADDRARHAEAVEARVRTLENSQASDDERHIAIGKDIARIETEKASREAVDGVKQDVANLRSHIDVRFGGVESRLSNIEGLLREALSERGSRE